MASNVKIKLNSRGILDVFDQWAKGDGQARAGRVEAEARSGAPVATGTYQGSIHTELVQTDRPVWRIVADAPHSHVVEAVTGNLARALDAAGGE